MKKILVIGESCRDVFVYCDALRLAPDVPIPVLNVVHEVENFGMAKNVYRNIVNKFSNCDLITNYNWNEITKTRYVHDKTNHTFFRVDSASPMPVFNFTDIEYHKYDVVVIADYNKGFLEKHNIRYICEQHPFVFVDTKKKVGSFLDNAFVIKINDSEYNNSIQEPAFQYLKDKIVHTIGAGGAFYQNIHFPTESVEVKDSSGAGDTFMAGLVIKWIETRKMSEAIKYANQCATEAVKHRGVTSI